MYLFILHNKKILDHHQEEPASRRVERNDRCGGDERRSFLGRNSTWQMMHLPPGLYPSPHHHRNLVLNSTTLSSKMSTMTSTVSTAKDTVTVSPVFLSTRGAANTETCGNNFDDNKAEERHDECSNGELDHQEQTLELFPLRKEGFVSNGGNDGEKEKENGIHCFYEFLPLKN